MQRALAFATLVFTTAALGETLGCGDLRISYVAEGEGIRLTVGEQVFEMRPVPAASGAKYVAVSDPSTVFWSKGDKALLEVGGRGYSECLPVAASAFRASGNEPFWRLDITAEELTLVTNLGENRLAVPLPAPEVVDGVRRYRVDAGAHRLEVSISEERCADTMTGMPSPNTVVVVLDGETLKGCGGDPASLLQGDEWLVSEIDGGAVIPDSPVSLAFDTDGRVSGAASCNRFMGGYALTGEGLTFSQLASTMMACAPELMDQEERFLGLLGEVQRFDLDADGALVLYAADGRTIRARRP